MNAKTTALPLTLISGGTNLLPVYSPAHMLGFVAWPELARHVGAGLSSESDAGGRGTAAGVEKPLRDGTGGCVP